MDIWLLFLSIPICIFLTIIFSNIHRKKIRLPPGPSSIPILTTILWLRKSFFDIQPFLRRLIATYGPIITLRITSRPAIFISDHHLTHQVLVQQGAIFADRPPVNESNRIITSSQHSISSASYGNLWRLLRRNLTSEILQPSRVKQFSNARQWVLKILLDNLRKQAKVGCNHDGVVIVMKSFQFAMFCLLVLMCFGEKLDEKYIREIEDVQKSLHVSFAKLSVFAFLPRITKLVFRKRWNRLLEIRKKQEEVFVPLIRARSEESQKGLISSYVDSLLQLQIPEEGGRALSEGEIVSLCSEFMSAGTDTTATALEWTMAELVRHPNVQKKLSDEIENVVDKVAAIQEDDLQKMPYLKAVILEGLRRHPPAQFVLPHAVTEEVEINGYVIPRNASVNFMVAQMGWDEKVWEEPMQFKPERFLKEGVDITGSREIKMMPFGVGRRICPGLGLAMLHLEYFVANLVREFEWKVVEGEEIDLSEKLELTVIMKNPLRARIVPRREN